MTHLRVLQGAVAALAIAVIVLALVVFSDTGQLQTLTASTTHALCAFRHDVQSRYDSGVKFLLSHRHGIPGISAGTIRLSLTAEQHTLAALSSLQCP